MSYHDPHHDAAHSTNTWHAVTNAYRDRVRLYKFQEVIAVALIAGVIGVLVGIFV